jgi:hypothetical protein
MSYQIKIKEIIVYSGEFEVKAKVTCTNLA